MRPSESGVAFNASRKNTLLELERLRQQRHARERHALHAGNSFETLADLPVDLSQLVVLVTDERRLNVKQQKVLRVEARIDALQVEQRAYKQSRTNQQQQRQRHLDHDESTTQQRTMTQHSIHVRCLSVTA